jgi:hypothetical protein
VGCPPSEYRANARRGSGWVSGTDRAGRGRRATPPPSSR